MTKYGFNEFLLKNKRAIELGLNLARGLKEFSTNKSYFSLMESGLSFIKESYLSYVQYSRDFLKEENGWSELKSKYNQFPLDLFLSVIEKYECSFLELPYGGGNIKVYSLPITDIAITKGRWDPTSILFKRTKCSAEELIDFLVEQKMKEIQCNIVSFNQAQPGIATASTQTYSFRCEEIRNINSIEADKYIESLLIAQKQNKCRSLLFYGPPGTGKSTIINNIVTKLNYRTLVINFNEITDYNMVLFVIDNFKFEAIVIDDFDLADKSANILKFLEDVRTKVKVVLGSANSLKSIYPALIRPGRFDEVIKIENLSEKTIRHIVGDMEIDFDRIKHWPVAYINELIYRIQLTGNLTNLEHDLVELNTRVSAQLESLKM
jgi:hypothetical protein